VAYQTFTEVTQCIDSITYTIFVNGQYSAVSEESMFHSQITHE